MRTRKYIKNLEWNCFKQFGNIYLNAKYTRNGEYNNITFKVNKHFTSEKQVREFIND